MIPEQLLHLIKTLGSLPGGVQGACGRRPATPGGQRAALPQAVVAQYGPQAWPEVYA